MRECATRRNGVRAAAATLCFLSASVITVAPAAAAPPPQNRTYFTVFLGLDGPYASGADCMRFTVAELCNDRGKRDSLASVAQLRMAGESINFGEPHLHFGVLRGWPVQEGDDVPVNLSNALGPLDERGLQGARSMISRQQQSRARRNRA